MKNRLEIELTNKYKEIWKKNKPYWTYNIAPAVPVIGDNLLDMPIRVLSYASSENIKKDYANNLAIMSEEEQLNRGRSKSNKKYPQFRYSHITPFNCGEQFIVTWFLLNIEYRKYIDSFSNVAMEFAEQIAVSNTLKFTIKRRDNQSNRDPNDSECFTV